MLLNLSSLVSNTFLYSFGIRYHEANKSARKTKIATLLSGGSISIFTKVITFYISIIVLYNK